MTGRRLPDFVAADKFDNPPLMEPGDYRRINGAWYARAPGTERYNGANLAGHDVEEHEAWRLAGVLIIQCDSNSPPFSLQLHSYSA